MSSETEPGIPDVTDAYGGPFTFEYRRMPDAVRAAALANAVDLVSNWTWEKPGPAILGGPREIAGVVLDLAALFEIYLADEEAHGTN